VRQKLLDDDGNDTPLAKDQKDTQPVNGTVVECVPYFNWQPPFVNKAIF